MADMTFESIVNAAEQLTVEERIALIECLRVGLPAQCGRRWPDGLAVQREETYDDGLYRFKASHEAHILEIDPEGLTFSEDGKTRFIDFALCHQHWYERKTQPEFVAWFKDFTGVKDEDLEAFHRSMREGRKVVAVRNLSGLPHSEHPYIEFEAQPNIRFVFPRFEGFDAVYDAILKAGWRTETYVD